MRDPEVVQICGNVTRMAESKIGVELKAIRGQQATAGHHDSMISGD